MGIIIEKCIINMHSSIEEVIKIKYKIQSYHLLFII